MLNGPLAMIAKVRPTLGAGEIHDSHPLLAMQPIGPSRKRAMTQGRDREVRDTGYDIRHTTYEDTCSAATPDLDQPPVLLLASSRTGARPPLSRYGSIMLPSRQCPPKSSGIRALRLHSRAMLAPPMRAQDSHRLLDCSATHDVTRTFDLAGMAIGNFGWLAHHKLRRCLHESSRHLPPLLPLLDPRCHRGREVH